MGNLVWRKQLTAHAGAQLSESFGYDALDRLSSSVVAGQAAKGFGYDAAGLGNIATKTNVGSFSYPPPGSAHPHAVVALTGVVAGLTNPAFSYDANGNLALGLNRGYAWNTANLPASIDKLTSNTLASATERTELLYGPERQRTKQTVRAMSGQTPGAINRTIYYAGAIDKEIDVAANQTTIRTYLPLGIGFLEEVFAGTNVAWSAVATANARFFLSDALPRSRTRSRTASRHREINRAQQFTQARTG